MNILNILISQNFLRNLYHFIINKTKSDLELSNITILLPSRRSCNELKRIFLEYSNNNAIILPNIKAIGDIDYDDLFFKIPSKNDFKNYIDFSANTSRIKYKILLIKELLKWAKNSHKNIFKNIQMEQVASLALELEKFLNEVNKNNLELDDLNKIVDDEYSQHWQEVLSFLQIFGKKWNKFIEDNNIISNTNYRTKILEFNAEYFKNNKPTNPIIIAGISSNVKSTYNLIKNILQYNNCYFIFNGLDTNLTEDEWEKVNVFHPQYLLKKLLDECFNIKRDKIININYNNDINKNLEKIISYAMLPYCETYKWQNKLNINKNDFDNISKIECENLTEELNIVSFITKYNYIKYNKTIAIITNNDNFANQLEIKLKNFNVKVNNTFGNKISRTDFVKYLFLILNVIKSDYESIALLSLLKHNLTLCDYQKEKLNKLILVLEDKILREYGNTNFKKLKLNIQNLNNTELIKFFDNFSNTLNELNFKNIDFQTILKKHIEIAIKLTSNNIIDGNDIFWNNEKNGTEILNFFNELVEESAEYGIIQNSDEYSYLLTYLIAENSYSDKYSIHPMVNIISPQEIKLLNYDLVIVSNLNESEFPPHIATDPWMSNSMRKNFNLPAKEEIIGSFAYDFTQLLCNKEVILTRAIKENGILTTKSKYLMRLETFLLCQKQKIKENNIWLDIYKKYNEVQNFTTISRPKPTPPLDKRPNELYATEIEKLINNPYDIYAKKILKLKAKNNFYDDKIFAFFGSATHQALENYVKNYKKLDKKQLFEKLINYGRESFDEYFSDEITKELSFIKFINIAKWFINEDEKIRKAGYNISAERVEKFYMKDLDFTISAKIDRVEEMNGHVNIVDYKTGSVPSNPSVLSGKKPQLVVEAIILESQNKKIENLVYWAIKGKDENSTQYIKCDNINDLIDKGKDGIYRLINYFKVYDNCYIATSFDLNSDNHYVSDYKHLSRVDEWGYL